MSLNPKISSWRGQRVWIIGGSTGIGRACAERLHAAGARVAVSARNAQTLAALADVHAGMRAVPLDATDADAIKIALNDLVNEWGGVDLVLFAAGAYTPTRAWELDAARIDEMMNINLIAAMKATAMILPEMLKHQRGTLAYISSVAGYRGLPKALVYGPSKAALTNFAETLFMDVRERGVGVVIINPGFVRTPMTAQNDFKMPALIEPEEAAQEIVHGLERGAFEIHFPKRFTRVLKFLRWWPDALYLRVIKKLTP